LKQRGPANLATTLTVTSSLCPFDAAPGGSVGGRLGTSLRIRRWLFERERQSPELQVLKQHLSNEVAMATERHGQIVETPTEARQAEPGPSVLALLTASTGLAVLILGIVWFAFFRV
jgi:hypothetical protein